MPPASRHHLRPGPETGLACLAPGLLVQTAASGSTQEVTSGAKGLQGADRMRCRSRARRATGFVLLRARLRVEPGDQLDAGGDAQLGEDAGDVRVDGAGGDDQPPGDLAVGEALAGQRRDLLLAFGQLVA